MIRPRSQYTVSPALKKNELQILPSPSSSRSYNLDLQRSRQEENDTTVELKGKCRLIVEDIPSSLSLHLAVSSGNRNRVKEALKVSKLDKHNSEGHTAISLAVSEGRVEMLKVLIRGNVDLYAHTKKGYTNLNLAVELKAYECIKELLKYGFRIDERDASRFTALMLACKLQDVVCLKLLLKYKPDLELTWKNCTALHIAIISGSIGCVRALIEAGANIRALCILPCLLPRMFNGPYPPIFDVIRNSKIAKTKYSSLAISIYTKKTKLIYFIANSTKMKFGGDIIQLAVQLCDAEIVKHLLNLGYDANRMNPLRDAIECKQTVIIDLLSYSTFVYSHYLYWTAYMCEKKHYDFEVAKQAIFEMLLYTWAEDSLHASEMIRLEPIFQLILLNAGIKILDKDFEKSSNTMVLVDWFSKVRTMKHLCRLTIRAKLKNQNYQKSYIERLPLPIPLIDYLLFRDIRKEIF